MRPVSQTLNPTSTSRIGRLTLMAVPLLLSVFCVILGVMPFGTVAGVPLTLAFGLIAVFYWTVNRPDLFPLWTAFAVGLFQDLLGGDPVGLWASVYVVFYAVVLSQRVLFVGSGAHSPWLGFVIFAFLAGLLAWLLASFVQGGFVAADALIFQILLTVVFYPFFRAIFAIIDRRLRVQSAF